jgi:hypothetical protein
MKSPIHLEDIEEFEAIRRIPRSTITDKILQGVKNLHEIEEIEPFLRDIIPDKNDTPHTSTEIVDILTPHLTYFGQPRLSAFINKGKSFPTVTAKNVSNQIFKLRRIPSVSLIVLLAVGDIQDDALENFLTTASDINAAYMIVDAIDIARLFIAYHKICAKDGVAFRDGSCPQCGTAASEPIQLILNVYEEPRYEIIRSKDVSHGAAKRYTVDVLTDPHYSKGTLREIIKKVIWEFRQEDFYRSRRTEKLFGEQDADCIFLFVFLDMHDVQQYNWICQTLWINPSLPKQFRPYGLKASEQLGEIQIHWNENYHVMRKHWFSSLGTKKEWIQKVETILPKVEPIINATTQYLQTFEAGKLTQDDFEKKLTGLEIEARNILFESGNEKIPPIDCEECDNYFQGMISSFHNILIWFSPTPGNINRTWENKMWLVRRHLKQYEEDKQSFLHEWHKLRS